MTALTTFDRVSTRVRHGSEAPIVPLFERTWFRFAGSAVLACWVAACVFMSALLVT